MFVAPNPATGFDMQVAGPADTVGGGSKPFSNYSHTFSGVSGSFGATYNFSDNFLIKANIARGFRAPNIAEISANGVHPGTRIYQVGNPNFLPEFSLQEDFGIMFHTSHVSGGVEVFNNDISNYIYNEKILKKNSDQDSMLSGNTVFQFQAAHAQLYGAEANLDIHPHPLDWLHFENSVSIVYGINKGVSGIPVSDSAKYLPFIPPLHTNSELRANVKRKFTHFSALYVKVGMQWYDKQDRAYLAFNTETSTPGYTLFDAGIGGDVTNQSGKVLFNLSILGNNITDLAYQAHLSRLKYFEQYSASPNGHLGIYNMGRNISFKLVVPFDFSKKKTE
jgi:iron complex outermembrane receptor protein